MTVPPALRLQNVGKSFGSFSALRNISLDFFEGEIHALVGENGAGKSTMIKLIAGVHQITEGAIFGPLGNQLKLATPRDALRETIGVVHQELDLFDNLTVAENIALGLGDHGLMKPKRADMTRTAREALATLQETQIDPEVVVGRLSTSAKQIVAIAKVLTWDAKVILFDEPTSALNSADAEHLLVQIRRLRDRGVAVIYVSHKLGEIFSIADRISVLRDGQLVVSALAADMNHDSVVAAMLGRRPEEIFPPRLPRQTDKVLLDVSGATGRGFDGISFKVHAGEIVGLAGLPDSGAAVLLRHLFGLDPLTAGTIDVDGQALTGSDPRQSILSGIAYLPADRLLDGILPLMSVLHNAESTDEAMAASPRQSRREAAEREIRRLNVRTASIFNRITSLSGGNQQKTLLARCLVMKPKILFLDDPTRGVDIGAKAEIYAILRAIAASGSSIVFTSSDSLELANLADRILLFRNGAISGTLDPGIDHAELDRRVATTVKDAATAH